MATTNWIADASHSEIGFRIKHLMITNVKGKFADFQVDAQTEGDDFSNAKISFSADVASISTGNNDRDNHLRSGDFFDAENHPKMTFEATEVGSADGDGNFKLNGNLSIRGVSKPVTLDVELGGVAKDPWGNTKAGFTITGKINRKDWGLTWNAPTEAGGLLVSEEVKLNIDLQLLKQG